MKLVLILASAGILSGLSAAGFRSKDVQPLVPAAGSGSCVCPGSRVVTIPSQLTGCGTGGPPLIVPTSPVVGNGPCDVDPEVGCETIANSNCIGTVEVQVTFPSSGGGSCTSVWVMGGTTYPEPTQINSNSQVVTLTAKAKCTKDGGSTSTAHFRVWSTQPQPHGQGWTPAPDASYAFTINCGQCAQTSEGGG
jgi:hypothetical protein